MTEKYRYKTTPKANEGAIVKGDKYRFTILTSRLIRIEYNEDGIFEDRATQLAVNRQFDVPEFSSSISDNLLTITTDHIELTYNVDKPFSQYSLKLHYTGKNAGVNAGEKSTMWSFGYNGGTSLGGTTRTLDEVVKLTGKEKSHVEEILKERPYYMVFAMDKKIFDSMEVLKNVMQAVSSAWIPRVCPPTV